MPDLSFLAAFAQHPATLLILTIGAVLAITVWRITPFLKDLGVRIDKSDADLKDKLDNIIESDKIQTADIADLKINMCNNVKDVLRITIYNESVAIEDRLVSARRYLLLGGNGKTSKYVKELIVKYPSEWRAILAMSKDEDKARLTKIIEEA
jgi:DNA integrity scanning protein DisA with diadenylate cyclase activity